MTIEQQITYLSLRDREVWHGDCLEQLRRLPDECVDSVVTDPPYGLSFMGRRWDYDVPSVEVWAECLRVLKPGGHLLAFAGTRTQHRMAVRIEDAGFEIRDMIAWVYGSGFPKSLDVSKAIDKLDAADERLERRHGFAHWLRGQGIKQPLLRDIFHSSGTFSTRDSCSTQASSYLFHAKQGPAIPPRYVFEVMRPHFGCEVPAWVERMVDERTVESENFKAREVLSERAAYGIGANGAAFNGHSEGAMARVTTAHTEAARQWEGWGTALKPALEPITVARKPLGGTVAANVLAHGTGALNIDGCRVGESGARNNGKKADSDIYGKYGPTERIDYGKGRWPANLIHDGSPDVLAQFPQTASGVMRAGTERAAQDEPGSVCYGTYGGNATSTDTYGDAGSAARFFYCAKAAKRDRGDGNNHPTVKPTDLMRYLCRLVTPPGGLVLDPFTGSGSTGKAARLEGFRFLGIEREAEYVEIARRRIG